MADADSPDRFPKLWRATSCCLWNVVATRPSSRHPKEIVLFPILGKIPNCETAGLVKFFLFLKSDHTFIHTRELPACSSVAASGRLQAADPYLSCTSLRLNLENGRNVFMNL